MMKRQQAKAQRRAQANRYSTQEIDISLPLRGIFVQAQAAKVSGLYAAELLNITSNGVALQSRPGLGWSGDPSVILQRVPHSFGSVPRYIELRPDGATCGTATFARNFSGKAMAATLSSNTILADGFGEPVRFNGETFQACEFTVETDAKVRKMDGVIAHHDRPYFWQSDGALEFYYGDVGAVTGPLELFPLDRLGNITGNIIAMASLTIDAGHGMNDILAIFTSTGQIVAYEGLDPGDANDWRLLGRIQAARPLSRRAFTQVGSDLWMATPRGIVSVAESIRSSTLALISDLSQPISDMLAKMVAEGADDWQMESAEDASAIIVNRVRGLEARQIVYTPQSHAWSSADMPVRAFHNFGGSIEGTGFDGRLAQVVDGGSEEVIKLRWKSSWFDAGRNVSVTYIRPVIRAKGPVTVRVWVLSDFNDTGPDIAEALQMVTLNPEEDDGGIVTISDDIGCDASGRTFQINIEIEATWAQIISMSAALG
ncbi:MAG: hypothetical protein IPM06_21010 [Rhizobiales bacterium]|nr:hypothetical protein [Hyphomicrobiales bacterium]